MDSLRYWVIECHVDGFRFDLASRAGPRALRRRPPVARSSTSIHQDPVLSQVKLIAEPWDVGPGGYQVGNFPVLWSEWNGIYRDVMRDFWRGQATRRRLRLAPHRLERPLRGRRPPPVRVDQLHHRPRRLHAARPRLLQRQAQRGQPGGQPRRHRRQPLVELRRRGRRPTTRRSTRCARASSATSSPRCSSRRARRCCSAATSSAARRTATTTPGARTTRSPGSTGSLLERERRAARVHPAADRAAPRRTRCSAAASSCTATDEEGSGLPDVWWFRPDGRRMTKRDWERRRPDVLGMFLNGEEIADAGRAGRADRRRLVPAAVQRPPRGRRRSRCRAGASARAGRSSCAPTTRTREPTALEVAALEELVVGGALAGAAARGA